MPRSHIAGAVLVSVGLALPAPALDLVGTVDTPGAASDLERANGLVYLADGTAGIRIFDVSVPSAPVQLGVYDTPGNGAHLSIDGTRIYVADGFSGMRILDAANPSAPTSLGVLATGGLVDDVLARGDVVYAVDRFAGFLVVDVSNPAAPAVVGSLPSLLNYRSIFRRGDVVYIVTLLGQNMRIDVSNPAAPIVVGSGQEAGFFEADGVVYWRDGGVVVSGPQFAARNYTAVTDFEAFDHFVVNASTDGVEIWDFSGPFEPDAVQLSSVGFDEWFRDIQVLSGRAYIAIGANGINRGSLEIYDVIDPAHPIPLGRVWVGSSVHDAKAVTTGAQTLVYTAQLYGGLRIADVTNPASPVLLGSYDPAGYGEGIDVVGNVAYLAAGTDGLLILDVSNPSAPALLAAVDTPGDAQMVTVRDGIAWVADGSSGTVRILDVSNPASPVAIGTLPAAGDVRDLALSGDLAYVAAWNGGLFIFNVANPAAPVLLANDWTFQVWSLALAGRTLWIDAYSSTGLVKMDVTDPTHPKAIARVPGGGYGRFTAAGRLLYGFEGVTFRIWDGNTAVAFHHDAALLDSLPGFTPQAIAVDGAARKAYLADGAGGGLRVIDLAGDLAALPCRNTDDDDGDGRVDAADAGCKAWDDPSEKPDCDDGIDQDGDGLIDYPADPGCRNTLVTSLEDPQCQDGVDNEGDGAIDYPADTRCRSLADDDELTNPSSSCGIGVELLGLALVPLVRRRAQIRRSRPRQ